MKMKTFLTSMFADRKDSATWAMIGSIVLQFACKSAPGICDVVQSLSQNIFGMDSNQTLGGLMLYGVLRATSKTVKAETPTPTT